MDWWGQLDTFSKVSLALNVIFFLVTTALAVALHRVSQRSKLLVVSHSRPKEIARLADEASAEIKIEYQGLPVERV
jgi:hypothetical protein